MGDGPQHAKRVFIPEAAVAGARSRVEIPTPAARRSPVAADTAIIGASVRTLWPERPRASAVAMRSGLIVGVGDDREIRGLCDARTDVIDGSGLALVPGLIDAHQHPIWGAELTAGVDLGGLGTLEELREALARERERVGPDGWVRGWGLEYGVFPVGEIDGA